MLYLAPPGSWQKLAQSTGDHNCSDALEGFAQSFLIVCVEVWRIKVKPLAFLKRCSLYSCSSSLMHIQLFQFIDAYALVWFWS